VARVIFTETPKDFVTGSGVGLRRDRVGADQDDILSRASRRSSSFSAVWKARRVELMRC